MNQFTPWQARLAQPPRQSMQQTAALPRGNLQSCPSYRIHTTVGSPTHFASDSTINAEGGKITSSPGVLANGITPLSWTEAVNMLNSMQLDKFNINLDTGVDQVTKLTLGEKWEGMSLVSANDPAHPFDYFLFIANDNDFLTSNGRMVGPDGSLV